MHPSEVRKSQKYITTKQLQNVTAEMTILSACVPWSSLLFINGSETSCTNNKAILDYSSPALCTPSHRYAMRPTVNVLEVQTCTEIWQRSRVWFRKYPHGRTDRHTHHNTSQLFRGRSNNISQYHCYCCCRSFSFNLSII